MYVCALDLNCVCARSTMLLLCLKLNPFLRNLLFNRNKVFFFFLSECEKIVT